LNYLKPGDVRASWERLQGLLKGKTLTVETWAIPERSGSFYARAVSDRVFIEGKNIKGIRTVSFPEWEKMAKYYNDYVNDVEGVKQKMRDDVGYNTPYILSLVHFVLEAPEEVAEEEPEPVERAKPEPVKHYKPRPRRA